MASGYYTGQYKSRGCCEGGVDYLGERGSSGEEQEGKGERGRLRRALNVGLTNNAMGWHLRLLNREEGILGRTF